MSPPDPTASITRTAAGAGAFTAVAGIALTGAPARVGGLLGLPDPAAARVIGISDLLIAPGLLAGRPRWPWLAARAACNVGLGIYLTTILDRSDRPAIPRAAAGAMAVLTVVDGTLAVRLRRLERG